LPKAVGNLLKTFPRVFTRSELTGVAVQNL